MTFLRENTWRNSIGQTVAGDSRKRYNRFRSFVSISKKTVVLFGNCYFTRSSGEMASNVPGNAKIAGSVVVRVEGNISEIDWTSISRSVIVTGFPAHTKSEDLIIHFQRQKNGGGDIEKIILSKKRTAVITFDEPEGERNYYYILS